MGKKEQYLYKGPKLVNELAEEDEETKNKRTCGG
jgi:hypothetical protein